MIDSEQIRVIYYSRVESGWLQSDPLTNLEETITLNLPNTTVNLTVAELYDEVVFEDED